LSGVKRQSIRASASFRCRPPAATSRTNPSFVPIRRLRHCPVNTLSSSSALFSQLPCLGV
jgi:hypothetical protein